MSQRDPFDDILFLEDRYFDQGKTEGVRYIVPASWFQGFLTGVEECLSFLAYVERHRSAAQLIVQLQPLLPPTAFDFDKLKTCLEKIRQAEDESKLYSDAELRKYVYNLCQKVQSLLEPMQFIERELLAESELNF